MKSLRHLVEKEGVTIVSVIHQPRKFIYDLFDSLILLGVGGKMVYHGPTNEAAGYFNTLNYTLPEGESVADWLIDISSGRLEPDNKVAASKNSESLQSDDSTDDHEELETNEKNKNEASLQTDESTDDNKESQSRNCPGQNQQKVMESNAGCQALAGVIGVDDIVTVYVSSKLNAESSGMSQSSSMPNFQTLASEDPEVSTDSDSSEKKNLPKLSSPLTLQALAGVIGLDESDPTAKSPLDAEQALTSEDPEVSTDSSEHKPLPKVSRSASLHLDEFLPPSSEAAATSTKLPGTPNLVTTANCVTDADCVGTTGFTTGKVVQAFEEAKVRRAWLYVEWKKHFNSLGDSEKKLYEVPSEYQLPLGVEKPTFLFQLKHQVSRSFIVTWRNRYIKFIESTVIIGAVIIITAFDGPAEVSIESEPEIPFEVMVRPHKDDVETLFTELFGYSLTRQIQ
jgi:hypothetical protein